MSLATIIFFKTFGLLQLYQTSELQTQVIFAINQTLASTAPTVSGEVVALEIMAAVLILIDIREEALVDTVKAKVVELHGRLSASLLPC